MQPINIIDYIDSLKEELVLGGHLTALGSPSIVLAVSLLLGKAPGWPILFMTYLLTLTVYGYNYYKELDNDIKTNPERASHQVKGVKYRRYVLIAIVLLLCVMIMTAVALPTAAFLILLILMGLVYSLGLKGLTKRMPALKTVYTASEWAAAGAFIPVFNFSTVIEPAVIPMLAFIFCRSMANVIFFDIKDIDGDREQGLKTIPVMLGKQNTLKLLTLVNLLSFIPILAAVLFGYLTAAGLALLPLAAYSQYYHKKAASADAAGVRKISYVLAEMEFPLWPMLITLGILVNNMGIDRILLLKA